MSQKRAASADVLKHVYTVNGKVIEFTVAGEYNFFGSGTMNTAQEDAQGTSKKPIGVTIRPGVMTVTLSANRTNSDFAAIFGGVNMGITTTFADGSKVQLFDADDISDADSHKLNKTTGVTGELTYQFGQSLVTEPT